MRSYHNDYYTSNNIGIIVIGKVDLNKIKEVIDDTKFKTNNQRVGIYLIHSIERPWKSSLLAATKSTTVSNHYLRK